MQKRCVVAVKIGMYFLFCSLLIGGMSSPSSAALRFLVLDTGKAVGIPDVIIMDIDHDSHPEWVYAQRGFSSMLVSGKYTDSPPTAVNREQVPLADLNGAIEPTLLVAGDQNGDGNDDLVIFRGPTGPAPLIPGFRLVQRDNTALGSGTITNYVSELCDDTLFAIDADGGKAFNETGTKTSLGAWYSGANESLWSRDTAAIGSGTWCRDQFDNAGSGCTNAIGALGDFNGDGFADAVRAYATCNNEIGIRSSNGGTSCPGTYAGLVRLASGLGAFRPRTCQITDDNCGTPNGFNMVVVAVGDELRIYEPDAASYAIAALGGVPGPSELIAARSANPLERFSAVETADLNKDGVLEVIAGTYNGEVIAYWRNDPTAVIGSGYWASVNLLDGFSGTSNAPITGIAFGDLDNDTQVEVIVGNNFPDAESDTSKTENAIIIDGLETVSGFSGNMVATPTPTITPTITPTPTSPPFALKYTTLDTGVNVGIPDVAIMDINQDSLPEWVYAQRGLNNALVSGKYNGTAAVNREEVPLASLNDAIEPSLLVSGDQNGDGKEDLVIFRGQTGGALVPGFRLVQRDNTAMGSGTIANYASELGDNTLYAIDADGGKGFNETGTKTSLGAWYAGANESLWSRDTSAIGSGVWCRDQFDNAGSGCANAIGAIGDWNGDGNADAVRAYASCNNEVGIRTSNGGTSCPADWSVLLRIQDSIGTYLPRTCQISDADIGTPNGYNMIVLGVENDASVGAENTLRIYEYGGTYGAAMATNNPASNGEIIAAIGGAAATRWTCAEFGDLDNDGVLEILAGTYDGRLFAFYRSDPFQTLPVIDGTHPITTGPWVSVDLLAAGFSGTSDAPVTGIASGDLDNDGQAEVLMGNNYPDGDAAAGSKHENAVIIDGLEQILFSKSTAAIPTPTPTMTPTVTPTPIVAQLEYLTLDSKTGTVGVGFPDVVTMDIDHDGLPEVVYAERGVTNSLVSFKYADNPPRQTVREAVSLAGLSNATEPRLLGPGDQNGDGLEDLIISGNVNNPGFRLVQRNNAALGAGTIANYAFEEEVRGCPFANDIDVGQALNEPGTKTSFGAWFTGWDEAILSRDNAAIGSGTWCMMSYDNAGSACADSAGCLGDFNGDGFIDGVRSYSGCNNETGVRGHIDASKPQGTTDPTVPLKTPGLCMDNEIWQPIELDRVAYNLGKFIPRCCRISDGPVNSPDQQNVMVAANATSLRVFEYQEFPEAVPPILYGNPMPSDGTTGNPSPAISGVNPFEIIFNKPTAQETVDSTSIARFGDLNGDGQLEIVIGTYDGNLIACYRSDASEPFGTGFWSTVDLLNAYDQPHNAPVTGLTIRDLDGDNQTEIVMSNDFPDATGNTAVTTHVIVIDGLENYQFTGIQNWDQY